MTTHAHTLSAASPARSRWRLSLFQRRNLWGIVFVLPALVFFAVFAYYPLARAVEYSFQNFNLLAPPRDVGLANYEFLLNNPRFQLILRNTFSYVVSFAVPVWIIGLMLALVFVQPFRGRAFYRTLYFVPVVLSETVISIVWRLIFHPEGMANGLLQPLTGQSVAWLTSATYAPLAVVIVSVWRVFGYYMIIFMTGLQNIPAEYYDAAKVDGADGLKAFRYVTLPLLRPTMIFVVIVTFLTAFQSFVYQLLITRGSPQDATNVLGLYIYQEAFAHLRYGRAAAAAMILFALLLVLTLVQLILLRSRKDVS
jgi:multiple sugar transport system permease protein